MFWSCYSRFELGFAQQIQFTFSPQSASSSLVSGKAENLPQEYLGSSVSHWDAGFLFWSCYSQFELGFAQQIQFTFSPQSASSSLVSGKAENLPQEYLGSPVSHRDAGFLFWSCYSRFELGFAQQIQFTFSPQSASSSIKCL
ncbi:MAG: hypothetical protein IIX96_01160 [Clostridia bacterium]|nr:hypothetical protein [Clostridia bacterium]